MTYPIGFGRMYWQTPIGVTKIIDKTKDPTWTPPASIKAEHLERYGEVLPNVVPAGPDNPLGAYAMRLGIPGYLIHGTNKRDGVGSRVSHGCIRLYPENIEELFNLIPTGTEVRIINQPVKAGWFAGSLFLEAHGPFEDEQVPDQVTLDDANRILMNKLGVYGSLAVNPTSIQLIVEQASGLPAPVIN
jgi:L,D-transpeptidase ErfK/SrfK